MPPKQVLPSHRTPPQDPPRETAHQDLPGHRRGPGWQGAKRSVPRDAGAGTVGAGRLSKITPQGGSPPLFITFPNPAQLGLPGSWRQGIHHGREEAKHLPLMEPGFSQTPQVRGLEGFPRAGSVLASA